MSIFYLPDLGEGLAEAEIRTWHITEGSEIAIDQLLVSVETAKAVVDVPSPISGRILKLYGNVGDLIKTGAPLVEYEVECDAGTVAGKLETSEVVITEPVIGLTHKNNTIIKVSPAVRALAQRLKVDLTQLALSRGNETITVDDVKNAAQKGYIPLTGVRRAMAQTLTEAVKDVVLVTVMDDAMVSHWHQGMDISVRLIKAVLSACIAEPGLNAWYDNAHLSRRLITEVHLGLAMDTREGLFVPVIRNAHQLDDLQLREKIEQLKIQVHNRSIAPADLQGATIILSNFGVFSGRYATPIVIPPMVAILGVGRMREGMLPLSLSVDHRAVTGGEATRFLGAIMKALSV